MLTPLAELQANLNRCYEQAQEQARVLNTMCLKNPFFGNKAKTIVT